MTFLGGFRLPAPANTSRVHFLQFVPVELVTEMRRAFTLIEILAVIAIIGVLAAVLFPVMASARDRSYSAVEVNAMRQLGMARQLYIEATGSEPLSVRTLVQSKHFPVELAASPADPTREGRANELVDYMHLESTIAEGKLDFRSSIWTRATIGCQGDPIFERAVGTDRGWAVMASRISAPRPGHLPFARGAYLRLLDDGSVRSKSLYTVKHLGADATSTLMLFLDFSEAEVKAEF